MIIGFKTGPKTWAEGKKIVVENGARMCEIWIDITKVEEYLQPLQWFADHNVAVGLHYWGIIQDSIKPNFATLDETIRDATIQQMKIAIDLAQSIKAVYVNVHPSGQFLEQLDLVKRHQQPLSDNITPTADYEALLLAGASELRDYAVRQNVLLTFETLPGRDNRDFSIRGIPYDSGTPTLAQMKRLGEAGCYLANDITHTAGQLAVGCEHSDSQIRDCMWTGLLHFTQVIAPYTRLIHVNTVIPPFDGSDSHNGLLPVDFAAGAFPSLEQLQQLLRIFTDRHDVFVVPEPDQSMTENYLTLRQLVA